MDLKKCTAILFACLLGCGAFSFAASAYRSYDCTVDEYADLSATVQNADGNYEVIVKTDGVRPDFRTLHPSYTVAGPDDTYVLCFDEARKADQAVDAMQSVRGVRYAEPNGIVRAQAAQPMADYTTYGAAQMDVDDFAAELMQRSDLETLTVAVVDSGIIPDLPVFHDRLLAGESFVLDPEATDTLGEDVMMPYDTDDFGHGTGVASIVADCTQGLPVRILPVKVLRNDGNGTFLDTANGIRYAAEQGAPIINLSIAAASCSEYLHDAIDYALESGSLTVSSSGNFSYNMDKKDCCPGHLSQGIVVAGCTEDGRMYTGACYGSTVDLCAPAIDVPCTKTDGSTGYADGTSFAAPHVSAVAAMLKLYMPDADVDTLTRLLIDNARDLGETGFDVHAGWGIPDLSGLDGTKRASAERTAIRSTIHAAPPKTEYQYREHIDPHCFYTVTTYSDGTSEISYGDFTRSGIHYTDTADLRPGRRTVTVTDGLMLQTSFGVTIRLHWWQWLIWIPLLGFLWY